MSNLFPKNRGSSEAEDGAKNELKKVFLASVAVLNLLNFVWLIGGAIWLSNAPNMYCVITIFVIGFTCFAVGKQSYQLSCDVRYNKNRLPLFAAPLSMVAIAIFLSGMMVWDSLSGNPIGTAIMHGTKFIGLLFLIPTLLAAKATGQEEETL